MSLEKSDFSEAENAIQSDRSSSGDAPESAWTEEEERAVRRKMDWNLVPLVTLLYLLCFLDRWVQNSFLFFNTLALLLVNMCRTVNFIH